MSNALPISMSNLSVPAAPSTFVVPPGTGRRAPEPPASRTRAAATAVHLALHPALEQAPRPTPIPPPIPRTLPERMEAARERIEVAAATGLRIRSYEVALDLDMSEFHFARQFRAAFGRSPHVYYDECRADRARTFLAAGLAEGDVARRIGFRRPAELRSLLKKCLVE